MKKRYIIRKPKSVIIPAEILEWLKEYRNQFTSEVACGLEIGVSRDVVQRAIVYGSCSPDSFVRIEKKYKALHLKPAA